MFDSIFLKAVCPHCKNESDIEFQTKDLECLINVYYKGDSINTTKFNYIYAWGDCRSKECVDYTNKERGYVSGFGRLFDVKLFIENSIITGKYQIIDEEAAE